MKYDYSVLKGFCPSIPITGCVCMLMRFSPFMRYFAGIQTLSIGGLSYKIGTGLAVSVNLFKEFISAIVTNELLK